MPRTTRASLMSGSPFFATPENRVALARERFFEDGVRPSGLVSETVIQSWARCVGARREPDERIDFAPVSKARIASALARNRVLLEAARDDLLELDHALAGTACMAMLASHDGVVVHATPRARGQGGLMPLVARVGVDIGEATIGTGAPGVAAKTGEACLVQGAEHFFTGAQVMYCAAAPIRDARGDIAGVLDLSCEGEMFRFDAASMVRLYATAIENRLLERQSRELLLLRFQASPSLLHTPLQCLAAVDGQGRVAWLNGSGASLLGCDRLPDSASETLFGLDVAALLALSRANLARPHRLPNGLCLWLATSPQVRDGARHVVAPGWSAPAADDEAVEPRAQAACGGADEVALTIEEANRAQIERALDDCAGNVSRAARQLGVSRGLLYRRMREWRVVPSDSHGEASPGTGGVSSEPSTSSIS